MAAAARSSSPGAVEATSRTSSVQIAPAQEHLHLDRVPDAAGIDSSWLAWKELKRKTAGALIEIQSCIYWLKFSQVWKSFNHLPFQSRRRPWFETVLRSTDAVMPVTHEATSKALY